MIKQMHFGGVWVTDQERAYDFYVNKLGFTVDQDRPMGPGFRFLLLTPPGGGAKITVCKPMPGMTGIQVGGNTSIAWDTDDIYATYEDLKVKGVEFPQPPAQQFWGGIQALFSDPDGNIFMLHQAEE